MDRENEEEYVDNSSELGKLILKVNLLEKRPLLDNSLGEILQSFMQSLNSSEDYLRNGIFKINFAEAALLLQSSASIYSKKVDLLWDMINECQKRLVSLKNDENENELQRIEERERKYKRRRQPVEVEVKKSPKQRESRSFHVNWQEIDDLHEFNFEKESKPYKEWYKKMICKWDLKPTQRSTKSLAHKQVQFRSPDNAICDTDQDNEFVVHTSKMESVIGLEELISSDKTGFCDFSFELYSKLYLVPKFLEEKQLNLKDLEENFIEFEKYIGHYRDQHFSGGSIYDEEYDGNLVINKHSPAKLRRLSNCSTFVPQHDFVDFNNVCVKKCQVNVLRLSVDELRKLSSRSADEVKKYWSEGEDLVEEHCHDNFLTEHSYCTLENATNREKNVGDEGTHLESCESNDEGYLEGSGGSPPPNLSINDCSRKIMVKDQNKETCIFERIDYKVEPVKTKRKVASKKIEVPEKRKKLSKASLLKLVVGITVDAEKFNSFYRVTYRSEEGEGQEDEEPDLFLDDPIDSSSRIGQGDENLLTELTETPILCTQDSGYESNFQYNEDSSRNDIQPSDFEDVTATPSELNRISEEPATVQQGFTPDDALSSEEKPLYQRVYEWKQHMSEKFKTLKSADFDIHEYGSNIMENFEGGKPRKFSSIVRGKSAADVTRFFISALQLANTNNVEIRGAQSGKLSNETFELKLISKDHYYDRLKDYMAPSEQDYHKRLSGVRNLKKRREDSSRGEYSNCKRKKFE